MNKPAPTRSESVNEHGAMIGDVLTALWGYDQTNYDYFQVIKATAKTVTLKNTHTGEILRNKRTTSYSIRQDEYGVRITSYEYAHFDPEDPQGLKTRKHEESYLATNLYGGH